MSYKGWFSTCWKSRTQMLQERYSLVTLHCSFWFVSPARHVSHLSSLETNNACFYFKRAFIPSTTQNDRHGISLRFLQSEIYTLQWMKSLSEHKKLLWNLIIVLSSDWFLSFSILVKSCGRSKFFRSWPSGVVFSQQTTCWKYHVLDYWKSTLSFVFHFYGLAISVTSQT